MRIVYVGAPDALAETLIERLMEEGNDVYFLSDGPLEQISESISLHHYYRIPRKSRSYEDFLHSISPECVIFSGRHYLDASSEQAAEEDITLLAQTLRAVGTIPRIKFVLLSSTEVYGNTIGQANESAPCAAMTETGIRFIREEQLADIYRRNHGMNVVILRASQLYTNAPKEGDGDFLSRSFAATAEADNSIVASVFQPLNVADFADAISRVVDSGEEEIYNVTGSAEMPAKQLYEETRRQENLPERTIHWKRPESTSLADSGRIRKELGWTDRHDLEQQLRGGEIAYAPATKRQKAQRARTAPSGLREVGINAVVFAAFFAVFLLCRADPVFSQVNWLLIYVVIISAFYSIYQSVLAMTLATAAYIIGLNLGGAPAGTYDIYGAALLMIMQFVLIGLLVSYVTNRLREEVRTTRQDRNLLERDYEDLTAINDENVLVKNEYEDRLLTSQFGFPKLYDLISPLMGQDPDRILMETMQVTSELVHTDTVAVYQGEPGSPWFRLVGALNNESAMEGKTWNLSESPRIYDAVKRGELYQGEYGSGEPAVVVPVICQDVQALILIKKLPYESETPYHINILKTVSLLLRDSMQKALQYEELSKDERFVPGTDILRPEAFCERVDLAREMREKNVAEFCVAQLFYQGSMEEAAASVSQLLRVTDWLGTDGEGRLFALLNNTSPENLKFLQKRLAPYGVTARLIRDDPGPDTSEKAG